MSDYDKIAELLNKQQFQKAEVVILGMLKNFPSDGALYFLLGEAYGEIERLDEARKAYAMALELGYSPDECYFEMGYLQCKVGQYEEAINLLHHSIDLERANADAFYWLGFALRKLERWEEAVQAFLSALQIDSEEDYTLRDLADTYISLGLATRQSKYFVCAEQSARQGLALEAQDLKPVLWCGLGQALYWQDRYPEAFEAYSCSLELERDAYTLMQLGDLYEETQELEMAEKTYLEAVSLSPDWLATHSRAAEFYYHQDRFREALSCYKRMSELSGGEESFTGEDWQHYGYCLSALEQDDEALKVLRHALRLAPDDVTTLYYMGNACMSLQNYQEAFEFYDKATHLEPEDTNIRFNLGLSLYELRRFSEAATHLKGVVSSEHIEEEMRNIAQEKLRSLPQEADYRE
jgi:tetratricopeptide (TPR) repeat protein